jgi:uncharacterized glyoxalase superfamily protein PhnB
MMGRATAIVPVLRYRDAGAAARWLCEAFGFQEHDRAQELSGNIRYVSLRHGDSFVLVRRVASSFFDNLMVQPGEIGGANTQSCYLTIPDVAEHCARAEAAGAKVEIKPEDDGLGGRFYTCRDLEGHLWTFGTRTYGAAHDAASAFEEVEMGPSRQSGKIAAPQGAAPARTRRGELLRTIGIAAITAVMVVGTWLSYDTYTRKLSRDATAEAASSRLEETSSRLARERSRRLLAEAAARKAAVNLAEGRTAAAQASESMQRAQAELAGMRREKEQAARALAAASELAQQHRQAKDRAEAEIAVAKRRIAETEAKLAQQTGGEAGAAPVRPAEEPKNGQGTNEELDELKAALLAANKTIDELRATQLEPMPPDGGDQVAENSPCVLAVQGKIASGPKGPTTWAAANLNRLCGRAEASEEPGKCFQELMLGKVNWGNGTTWATSNALALCGATQSARKTIDCFKKQISSQQPWRTAIKQCKTS